AGAVAAFTVDLLVYPLDTIKTRLQSRDYLDAFAASTSGQAKKACATAMHRGLYQGVGSVIVATLPAAGIFFTTYEACKGLYGRALPSNVPAAANHALAAGTAELASCAILTPAEVIKQNAQMLRQGDGQARASSTSMEALRMLWRSEGGAGARLWRGYTALAARNLPFTAMQFPMFEFARGRLWAWRDRRRRGQAVGDDRAALGVTPAVLETGLITGASAAASGSISAVVTTPTDVVKTRMMLSAGEKRANRGHRARSQGGLAVAKLVWREKGIRGLFRGGLLRAGWTALGSGLYLGSYEMCKVWLKGGGEGARDVDL
ncbi:mitochondrial carrier, partial [Thozetella sp. PMI_491]